MGHDYYGHCTCMCFFYHQVQNHTVTEVVANPSLTMYLCAVNILYYLLKKLSAFGCRHNNSSVSGVFTAKNVVTLTNKSTEVPNAWLSNFSTYYDIVWLITVFGYRLSKNRANLHRHRVHVHCHVQHTSCKVRVQS